MLAKLASEYKKPDGLYQIEKGREIEFIDSLKLKDLWGIGGKSLERFHDLGITEIRQLRMYSMKLLAEMFGEHSAGYIYTIVRGEDPGVWNCSPKSRSISSEVTFEKDIRSPETIKKELLDISRQLMFRLNDSGFTSRTVSLKIKYFDFTVITAQTTLTSCIKCSDEIYSVLCSLLENKLDRSKPVRLTGASLMSLEDRGASSQLDLFEDNYSKKGEVEKAVQALSKKRPGLKIFKAALIDKFSGN